MAKVENVSKYLLSLVEDDCDELMSNMKLQKLLYYCQGYHLAIEGKELFSDDIEAWRHGPVVPKIYHTYKEYDATGIPKPIDFNINMLVENERNIINQVFGVYGKYSALGLRNKTHNEKPWKETYKEGKKSLIIPKKLLKEFFITKIED